MSNEFLGFRSSRLLPFTPALRNIVMAENERPDSAPDISRTGKRRGRPPNESKSLAADEVESGPARKRTKVVGHSDEALLGQLSWFAYNNPEWLETAFTEANRPKHVPSNGDTDLTFDPLLKALYESLKKPGRDKLQEVLAEFSFPSVVKKATLAFAGNPDWHRSPFRLCDWREPFPPRVCPTNKDLHAFLQRLKGTWTVCMYVYECVV
jgi:hypothetical protein